MPYTDDSSASALKPFGPFIRKDYQPLHTSRGDIICASVVFGLAMFFAMTAAFIGTRQTLSSKRPLRSVYIWMIWLEWSACIIIAILCLLFLLNKIAASFYFYMGILFLWSIQIQLLLQIIINRIRIILHDRRKGRMLTAGVAFLVSLIIISVFCIWIPARLQISAHWIRINDIWDRIEKGLYLIIDACLNLYFIRVVKANLVRNGLQKYNHLVRFNMKIIVVSLLMDVMIIAAMSIPNGFVYAIFHPLAYLVKLNIEMSMAHLIKTIALSRPGQYQASNVYSISSVSDGITSTNSDLFAETKQSGCALLKSLFGREPKHPSTPDNSLSTGEFVAHGKRCSGPEFNPPEDPDDRNIYLGRSWEIQRHEIESSEKHNESDTDQGTGPHNISGNELAEKEGDEEAILMPEPAHLRSHRLEDT